MNPDQLLLTFIARLNARGGIVCQVADSDALLAKMTQILKAEKVNRAMAALDPVVGPLKLRRWGRRIGIEIVNPHDYPNRESYTRAVFDDVQAGITGVDFAVAESGTLVLAHGPQHARLISLAPVIHLAVVPVAHLVPVYENALASIYTAARRPSQVTFITGPSMTADIQATPFKGMHGPRTLIVFLVGQ
jgi:L-lactate dehydrogenase complex protein LldG